ncbi:MAG: hypothetical protein JXR91_04060 [Deltaproteobacteria bacterium]|nr:hypothetical protein [Deltaproteobacteria bacterium]
MDFLILTPPVMPSSEPPSGAFMLSSALMGQGYSTGFFDLSLEFYYRHFKKSPQLKTVNRALHYFNKSKKGYTPDHHRGHSGTIHKDLKRFSADFEGWRLTAMDIEAPIPVHNVEPLKNLLQKQNPFADFFDEVIPDKIALHRPKKIIVSVAYLSQLAGAIALNSYLQSIGITAIFGGSLFRSLKSTGNGFDFLTAIFKNIDVSNGSTLIFEKEQSDFLNRLHYPTIISDHEYIGLKPVFPLTLSIGCYYSSCLFCPDRDMKFSNVAIKAIDDFLNSFPKTSKRPLIHLLDSAIPINRFRDFLPVAKSHKIDFYGFARPEKRLSSDNLLTEASQSGLTMLQLGVENGNHNLLNRYNKGIDPIESQKIMRLSAEAGIKNYIYMLFGLPGETTKDNMETLEFLNKNSVYIDFFNLSIFNLPSCSELTTRAEEFNIRTDNFKNSKDAISLYKPFTVNGKDPRHQARDFIQNHIYTNKTLKQKINQTPRWFRAAHLAMMDIENRKKVII